MAKFPMDLKGFKKTASDNNTTTLVHKNGHQIRLAHKALSEDHRKMIKALPFSDEKVRGDLAKSQEPIAKRETPKQPVQSEGPNDPVQKFAEGGKVDKKEEQFKKNAKEFQKGFNAGGPGLGEMVKNVKSAFGYADGGLVEEASDAAQKIKEESPNAPVTINIGQPAAPSPAPMTQEQSMPAATPSPHPVPPQAELAPSAQPPQSDIGAIMNPSAQAPAVPEQQPEIDPAQAAMMQGANQQIAGIQGEANAMGALGKEQAGILDQSIKDQEDFLMDYQSIQDQENQEIGAMMDDIKNQHIDPRRLLSNQSTMGKIGTAIGLMLGGMGGAVTGEGNPVLKHIQQQIDNDINAQKMELGKKENLLNYNFKKFGNMKDAMEMTKATQLSMVKAELEKAAAQALDPIAKARAMHQIGELNQKIAPKLVEISANQAINKAAAGGNPTKIAAAIHALKNVSPEKAKDLEERFIPGVGLAQSKPTDKDRDTLATVANINKGLTELQALATQGPTVPGSEADAVNKTKIAALQLQMKTAYQLGVLSTSDLEMLDKLVADPGSMRSGKAIKQLEATKQSMNSMDQAIKSKLGIQGEQQQSQVRYMNGKPYKKVPGGWVPAQ